MSATLVHPAALARAPRPTDAGISAAPLRLTRRGRLALFGLGLLAALGSLVALGPSVLAGDTPLETTTETVLPGESLWQIAGEANPGGDVRDTMDDIVELNGLTETGLAAGQKLVVPVY